MGVTFNYLCSILLVRNKSHLRGGDYSQDSRRQGSLGPFKHLPTQKCFIQVVAAGEFTAAWYHSARGS